MFLLYNDKSSYSQLKFVINNVNVNPKLFRAIILQLFTPPQLLD